jgi:hypothetical protein
MWDAHEWKIFGLSALAWGVIGYFYSHYLGYRRYAKQEDEREKRCHHTLGDDEYSILLQALTIAKNALRDGAEMPSDYDITPAKLNAVYRLFWWADDGIKLKSVSPFDEAPEPDPL